MTNEAVEMFLRTEVDDVARAPLEPVCEGATLKNGLSRAVC